MSVLTFNERQQKTIAGAITLVCGAVIVLLALALLSGVVWFAQRFSGVFLPLALAGLLALVLKPYYDWWLERVGGRGLLAVLLVYGSLLLPLIGVLWFFGAVLLEQIAGFFRSLPVWLERFQEFGARHLPAILTYWESHGLSAKLQSALQGHAEMLTQGATVLGAKALSAGSDLFGRVVSLFSWVVFPIYLTFFLRRKTIDLAACEERILPFLKPETRRDLIYLVREFVTILVAFFRGQFLVALAQGLCFAIGFMLAGLQYGFVLGLILGFLNIIPYLGSMLGLGVALPLAFLQEDGGGMTVLWVLVVFVAVQMLEGYWLTPQIMGNRTGLHPVAIMVALFFWGSAFGGIAGMLLAIPLTAFLVVFWRLLRTKYIRELV
jgi:predicted PurR-regulated permease PerM